MENFESIYNYLLTLGPAITSIVTCVATIIVGIKKLKAATSDSLSSLKRQVDSTTELTQQLNAVVAENAQLRKELVRLTKKAYNIYDDGE